MNFEKNNDSLEMFICCICSDSKDYVTQIFLYYTTLEQCQLISLIFAGLLVKSIYVKTRMNTLLLTGGFSTAEPDSSFIFYHK